jgi:hypothetical protein
MFVAASCVRTMRVDDFKLVLRVKSFLQGLKPNSNATLRGGYKPPPPKEGRG